MPLNKFSLARYQLIHQLLSTKEFVRTSEIVAACEELLGFSVTMRTIQLDLQAMRYDQFLGIFAPISYCASRKAYYYHDNTYTFQYSRFSVHEIELVERIKNRWKADLSEHERSCLRNILHKMQRM